MSAEAIEPMLALHGNDHDRPCDNHMCRTGERAAWRATVIDAPCGCTPVMYICERCRSIMIRGLIRGLKMGCRKHELPGKVAWTRI